MGFEKQLQPKQITRFKEFDEAREFIIKWPLYERELVFAAIDYMIVHKEYYFLLKNLFSHNLEENNEYLEQIIDYLFSRLECLKRKEDKQELKKLLLSNNKHLSDITFSYILDCYKNKDELYVLLNGVDMSIDKLAIIDKSFLVEKNSLLNDIKNEYLKRIDFILSCIKDF